jgi:hypothetical protein
MFLVHGSAWAWHNSFAYMHPLRQFDHVSSDADSPVLTLWLPCFFEYQVENASKQPNVSLLPLLYHRVICIMLRLPFLPPCMT